MKCLKLQESLAFYADGTLPADDTLGFKEHLRTCPSCREELEALQEALGLIRRLEAPHVPKDLHHRIMTGIREERKRKYRVKSFSRFGVPKFLATAAAFFLLFFIGGNYYLTTQMLPGSGATRSQAEYSQDDSTEIVGKEVETASEEVPPADRDEGWEALAPRSLEQTNIVRNILAYNAFIFALGGGLWYYYRRRGNDPRETGD